MRVRGVIVAVAVSAVASSVMARPAFVTPSGRPDAVFPGMTADAAQAKITSFCMDKGMNVVSTSPGQVVCEAKMGMMQSVLAQALIGNSYSTTPRQLVRFNVVSIGADARAQANAWIETQMAFGQMRQEPLDGDKITEGLESFLLGAGGSLPVGTLVNPGIAYIGFQGDAVVRDPKSRSSVWPVRSVDEGSPGQAAGLQPGDVITKLNGETARNQDDFRNRLARIRNSGAASFTLVIERNGAEQTLTLSNVERPPTKVAVSLAELQHKAAAAP